MKCTYLFLLSAALVSAVHASGGQVGANSEEYGSARTQDAEPQRRTVARSDELQRRLSYLPLIPGVAAAMNIMKQRKQRKERQRIKRDLDYLYDARDLDNSAEYGLQGKQNPEHDSAMMARSDDIQPRLAFLSLIPGLGVLKALKGMRHHRRDLDHEYEVHFRDA